MLGMPPTALAQPATPAVERDPVCGMNVNPAVAKHIHEHDGKKHYFCSAGCVEKFKANPERYRDAPSSSHQMAKAGADIQGPKSVIEIRKPEAGSPPSYVCPMCPEVREPKPGACPSCGMALEPDVPLASTRTEYTCPMHPEIVRPAPGSCPICGMALEPRTVTATQEENPELRDMTRRFLVGVILTMPLLAVAMGSMIWPEQFLQISRELAFPGSSSPSPLPSSSGAVSRSSSASGRRSSTAAPTCSP